MSMLKELWYGNIKPSEYNASSSEEYKEALCSIINKEEKLQSTFTDEQKELFSQYTDAVCAYQSMADCFLFQHSFRLGARMMLEVMEE